ncbi:MAG: hypothetical protein EPN71_15360 [Rhodanobacter sp.]|nr:MAG: hypothetical protein EPN71_15360 [Rhodanobacter sp.]TAM40776.1 MAG: hypothetical protein EPN58_09245 [Rhodanobacter sp.]
MTVMHFTAATPCSVRSLVDAACSADPSGHLAPVSESNCSTVSRLIPTARALLRTAAEIERDPVHTMEWYHGTPIAELGHLTARQLVALGRGDVVIEFLRSIQTGVRD